MHIDLNGKIALVTGGARDIGRAVSLALAESGASVAVNYHSSADRAKAVVEEIRAAGGKAVAIAADVTKSTDVARLMDETAQAFGDELHILVNNAGGIIARKTIADMDETFFDSVMTLNFKSVFLVTKAATPRMPAGSAIVNVASLAARDGGGPGSAIYAAAKGAVLTLTRGLSKELASRKIRVNCVSPGMIDTTFHDLHTKPEARSATAARTAIGREGTPADVANAVVFLASDAAAYLSGESIEINGGLYFV
jgi:3-oxoacyl-[acyl-carrier protein] reductase